MTYEELEEILLNDKPSDILRNRDEELFELIPELRICKGFDQNNEWHIYDVFEHILHVVDNVKPNLIIRLAALFHDVGKPLSYVEDELGFGHYYGHWNKSKDIFEKFIEKQNVGIDVKIMASKLIEYHDINFTKLDEDEIVRIISKFDIKSIKLLYEFKKADLLAQNSKYHYISDTFGEQEEKLINIRKSILPKRITIEDKEEFLRQISKDVDFASDDYIDYIDYLRDFSQSNEVYALAPVQIGIPKRIIYIRNTTSDMTKNSDEDYNEEIVYINPTIKNMYGHTEFLEACASCKYSDGNYIAGVVDRPYKIDIEYYDINGEKHSKTIEGFEATVFSHEYDHLNGVLHMDRLSFASLMTLEEMREYRTNNPYRIINKEDDFLYKEVYYSESNRIR